MIKKLRFIPMLTIISIMMGALFSISANAITDAEWEFQLLDNEVTITGYTGNDTNVVIPDKLFGTDVTKIELSADKRITKAQSITFPGSVKVITQVIKPGNDTVETVILKEGVEEISDEAFIGCSKLANVQLPSTLKVIGARAFGATDRSSCKALENISLPDGLKKLGTYAFHKAALTSIDMSNLSKCVCESHIFFQCEKLKEAQVGRWDYIPNNMFANCTSLESIDIPNTVSDIRVSAFETCKSLRNIVLPTSLINIEHYAFKNTALKEIIIP